VGGEPRRSSPENLRGTIVIIIIIIITTLIRSCCSVAMRIDYNIRCKILKQPSILVSDNKLITKLKLTRVVPTPVSDIDTETGETYINIHTYIHT